MYRGCQKVSIRDCSRHWVVKVISYPTGKSSMPLSYGGQVATHDMASRNTSRSTEQPTSSRIHSTSPRTSSVLREEPAVESETPRGPNSVEPPVRYSESPRPTVKCDGFKLCDNFSEEVAHVVSRIFIGFLATIAWPYSIISM